MTTPAATPITERVSDGIDFLDRVRPGWDERINLDVLNLHSCKRCILGQLFGSFADGEDTLELAGNDTTRLGFDLELAELGGDAYDELTAAWTDAIRDRRQVVAS